MWLMFHHIMRDIQIWLVIISKTLVLSAGAIEILIIKVYFLCLTHALVGMSRGLPFVR